MAQKQALILIAKKTNNKGELALKFLLIKVFHNNRTQTSKIYKQTNKITKTYQYRMTSQEKINSNYIN